MVRLIAFLSLLFSLKTFAVTAELVAESPAREPIWGIEFLSEDEIIFTERHGRFKILNLQNRKITPVKSDLKVTVGGQGGLLDVGIAPKSDWIYFTYSCDKPGGNTTCLGRAKLKTTKEGRELQSREEVFAASPAVFSSNHFGSRLAWDREGRLFLSTGDRYSQKQKAQKLDNHLGKILRISDEGKAEIWSYGHRNVQGLAIHPKTGELWAQEHGARGGDEINLISKGKNYGWPEITHGRDYSGLPIGTGKSVLPGMEQPFYHFTPSIAPSGLMIYSGKKYKNWEGHIFSGALAGQHLNRLEVADGNPVKEERLFSDLQERIRDVKESPAGEIYFSTDSGRIYRAVLKETSQNATSIFQTKSEK